ncbi:ABC transporter ATP-binding protein [Secundilactobacillus folii]|uniref:ATP-binding cassette domain-containing protein n=1 Tax=Secundilactobacillus folii TaxID=2678357 RepID=A0A7X2XXC6_9LACO|nr:ABC transporter ATP-binding protein [Secundilactobacillus folii]MTV82071.1 ATP-binding cassette domain-containing protein [Secundilactobacillus folii]
MPTIKVDHLSFSYPTESGETPLTLNDISASFPSHHFSLLTGASGSGKSTLMKIISGLYPQFGGRVIAGQITLDGNPVPDIPETNRGRLVAMMFQNPNQQFAMDTVEREVIFALENQHVAPSEMMSRVTQALRYVEIEPLRHRNLNSLSGGEKQKVALAVIIAMQTDTILLDEPFASVDPEARQLLLAKLSQLQRKQGKTIIISDHDLEDYGQFVDELFVLDATGEHLEQLNHETAQNRLQHFSREQNNTIHFELPTTAEKTLYTGRDLSLQAGERTLINQPELGFFQHHITLLTGPNGSGKSTLLSAMSKLHDYGGSLTFNHKEVAKIRPRQLYRQVAMVFQDADQQFLNVTVEEEIALSLKNSQQHEYFKSRLSRLLTSLHLDQLQDHVVYTLSGGQKKKLQILEMLMMATPVLLFDEPFTGLDLASMQQIMAVMKQVATDCQLTLIIISHQLFGLNQLIDYHLTLANKKLEYVEGLA